MGIAAQGDHLVNPKCFAGDCGGCEDGIRHLWCPRKRKGPFGPVGELFAFGAKLSFAPLEPLIGTHAVRVDSAAGFARSDASNGLLLYRSLWFGCGFFLELVELLQVVQRLDKYRHVQSAK